MAWEPSQGNEALRTQLVLSPHVVIKLPKQDKARELGRRLIGWRSGQKTRASLPSRLCRLPSASVFSLLPSYLTLAQAQAESISFQIPCPPPFLTEFTAAKFRPCKQRDKKEVLVSWMKW